MDVSVDPSPAAGRTDPSPDLINALTVIRGRAQVTRRRLASNERQSPERLATELAEIEAQADKVVRLLFESVAVGELRGTLGEACGHGEDEGESDRSDIDPLGR